MLHKNKSYELSYAELKKIKGFENVTEDAAKEICFQLKELSFIFYEVFQMNQKKTHLLSKMQTL